LEYLPGYCPGVTRTVFFPENENAESSEIRTFPEMAEMEQTLADLAELLPEALTDPGLAKIVWREAKANEEDEPYALWSRIADVPTPSGVTLRSKIHDIKLKRSRGKVSVGAESFTSSLDDVEYLQVYIHDFEDWDSTSTLPTTFTPLTINDIDVTELTLYDSLGNTTILEVDTVGPVYPIAIIGINEGMVLEDEINHSLQFLGKTTSLATPGYYPYITQFKAKKHPKHYEPWYAGVAEVYWIANVTKTATGVSKIGAYNGKWDYKCWKLTWRGYRSDRKYRTWNHKIDPFDPSEPNNVTGLEFWEYDPLAHDGLLHDPWYEWDCDNLENWPLIRDLVNIICDIFQNNINWGGNDDKIGSVSVNLTTSVQEFDGDGVKVKMKKKWYN
jgi:hypothetical protein